MPLDTHNDLLTINDAITPAVGQFTHLTGRVLTATGQPIRNAFVEIWQVTVPGVTCTPGAPANRPYGKQVFTIFTTQLLVKGLAENARDGIVKRLDAKALDR